MDKYLTDCLHSSVWCINPYEIIRKYKCDSCGGIMMCGCEQEFANRYLSHQITYATEINTRRQIIVTLGFQKDICDKCRGLPEKAYPRKGTYGSTSKVTRYYWREISFTFIPRFAKWAESQGYSNWTKAILKEKSMYEMIKKEVIEEIKKAHSIAPKYIYQEESQEEVIKKNCVEIINIDGIIKTSDSSVLLLDGTTFYSPESYVIHYFEKLGYQGLQTESIPFHTLFGVFL